MNFFFNKNVCKFYMINQNNLNIRTFNLEELNKDNNLLQIIPNKKNN